MGQVTVMPDSEKNSPSQQTDQSVSDLESARPENIYTKGHAQHDEPGPEVEIGGRDGLEPTRYGDWEKNGRCTDF